MFFYEKILYAKKAPKSTKSTKKHQKHKKQKNATKQKHKTQIREQKLKMRLKNIWVENSNLSASLRFCVFCVSEGKKKWKVVQWKCTKYLCPHKPLQVRICVPAQTGLWGHKFISHFNLIKLVKIQIKIN